MADKITPWVQEEELTSDRMNQMVGEANQIDTSTKNSLEAHKAETTQQLSLKANKKQGSWITATLISGWSGTIRYRRNDLGLVTLDVHAYGGVITKGTTLCTLPASCRPSRVAFGTIQSDASIIIPSGIRVDVNGDIRITNDLQSGVYYLGLISFPADSEV